MPPSEATTGVGSHPEPGAAVEWVVSQALFDLDGTLIDSIPAVEDAWRLWADVEGLVLPADPAFHGRTVRDMVSSLVAPERVQEATARLTEIETRPRLPIRALPGALDLIAALPADRWAVVTSAARPVALARMAAAGIPKPRTLVTGDDIGNGKPDPEPFRTAFHGKDLARSPVAFEDTIVGLRSARAAGCLTVGVAGATTASDLSEHADAVVTSLADVTVLRADDSGIRLRLQNAD